MISHPIVRSTGRVSAVPIEAKEPNSIETKPKHKNANDLFIIWLVNLVNTGFKLSSPNAEHCD
jgi:hypothetical protein